MQGVVPNAAAMILTLILAAAAAAAAVGVSPEQARFERCVELVTATPVAALVEAGEWRLAGGGLLARQCEGLAYATQKRWGPAAVAFEAAARAAENVGDGRAATYWVQSGNAALLGAQPAKARAAFDAAIARGVITGMDLGEVHLDRARARFALGDKAGARGDLDAALKLVPADPLAWLLSATLARQSGDLARATVDIANASSRSPDDASVALEAGNIALLSGSNDAARTAWEAAVRNAPASVAGKAAAQALARLGK